MRAIEAYLEMESDKVLSGGKCPYDIPKIAKRMPKQDCSKGCSSCWNKELKEEEKIDND